MKRYKFASFGRLAPEFKNLVDNHYQEILTCEVFDSAHQLAEKISNFNAFAGFSIPENVKLDSLEWIHSFGAGVDEFIEQHDISNHIVMTRTTGQMGTRMAEFCLAYILHDLKSIAYVRQLQHDKEWSSFSLTDLTAQRVLIFGTGAIGSAIGKILSPLCTQVDGVNRSGKTKPGFTDMLSIDSVKKQDLSQYDIIINALPLTPTTEGLFDKELFSLCREVFFMNIGRGGAVNTADLLDMLSTKKVRKAVLDVFEIEPLPKESPLWSHPNIIVTPHHSGKTNAKDMEESFHAIYKAVSENLPSPLFVDISKGY